MKFFFRADGNPSIGAGHVMRCLSIADAARIRGIGCEFISAGDSFAYGIESRGYKNTVMDSDYMELDHELPKIIRRLRREYSVVLFVDSYFVTKKYLDELRHLMENAGGMLVYIDDLLSFPYPCNILLNYNIYADEKDYIQLYGDRGLPKLLLNTAYAPLRREYSIPNWEREICRPISKKDSYSANMINKEPKHIFVSTGGADFEHIMLQIVQVIKNTEVNHIFHVIVGSLNEDRHAIIKEAEGVSNIVLEENVTQMAELMYSCDVAISAAGSTLYELCATKTPVITYTLADNQISGAMEFSRRSIMKYVGDVREIGAKKISLLLVESAVDLCDNPEECESIIKKQSEVVDGKGAERIVDTISQMQTY